MNHADVEPAYAEYLASRSELRAEHDELGEHLHEFMQFLWDSVEPHPSHLAVPAERQGTIEHTVAFAVNEVLMHWTLMMDAIGTLIDACESRHLPGHDWAEDWTCH